MKRSLIRNASAAVGVSGLGSGEMFSAVVPELSKGREVTEPQISFAFHLVIQESE